MKANKIYMHSRCLDVAIEVLDAITTSRDTCIIKYMWLNLGYTGTPWFCDGEIHHLELSPVQLLEWADISDKVQHRRDRPGRP
jgi:hypothetical protein